MIKNLIYLDQDKMYSLSSQIFEGVSEYIVSEKSKESGESEEQKGPIGSGKVLGDILKQSEKISEKKFLIDHSYTLFEDKLLATEKVIIRAADTKNDKLDMSSNKFIKVKFKAIFNDIRAIQNTVENFNEIGAAFNYVTNFNTIKELKETADKSRAALKNDREALAKFNAQLKLSTNMASLAAAAGLQYDSEFLKQLSFIFTYGFEGQFEVQMRSDDKIFSANLKREYLRENEGLLIRKYSRKSEIEFTLFGLVTQCEQVHQENPVELSGSSLKEAINLLISNMINVESHFMGRLHNEIIIDPIALYTEID